LWQYEDTITAEITLADGFAGLVNRSHLQRFSIEKNEDHAVRKKTHLTPDSR
jgi:hypothetical protein